MKQYIIDHFTGANGLAGTIGAGAGSIIAWCFGEFEIGLKILITCMALDYLMGMFCGKKEKNLSSEIGFNGLKKKFTILIILMLAVMVDRLLGQGWVFRTLVIYFYIGIEGLSILENAVRLNAPVPDALKDALVQLKEGNKKEIKDQNK
ncbi:phage holin family protein [Clostridium sporogenes]|uniref:phage holin family protein n=1 Tax=Clostridium sporogenes TaxID=1509 RepID=UPI000669829A|nr:phage holin family protein [Clostridium sporogenes]EJE7236617.1 phage holin family protein [Clostridium botulinum]MBA4509787.1 phage holin family protein [Clostridium sporogenes]